MTVLRDVTYIGNSTNRSIIIKQPSFYDENNKIIPQMLVLSNDAEQLLDCNTAGSSMEDALTGEPYIEKGILPWGSVLFPGSKSDNVGFDHLVLLESSDGEAVLILIENKRVQKLDKITVQNKVNLLKEYRDKLFVRSTDQSNRRPERAAQLQLPLVHERNVVFVILTAAGSTIEDLSSIVVEDSEAQVVHIRSESFFGPTFSLLPAVRFYPEK